MVLPEHSIVSRASGQLAAFEQKMNGLIGDMYKPSFDAKFEIHLGV
jgi:hypothetical protein